MTHVFLISLVVVYGEHEPDDESSGALQRMISKTESYDGAREIRRANASIVRAGTGILKTKEYCSRKTGFANQFEASKKGRSTVTESQGTIDLASRGHQHLFPPLPRNFECRAASAVCLHEDYIVALEDTKQKYGYYSSSEPDRLQWFEDRKVQFNQPGFFDGAKGVQRSVNPIRVRHVANSMESTELKDAPRSNVTPLIFYPTWPFNIGDSFANFMFPWAEFEEIYPIAKQMPIIFAIPYGLSLPSHFRLFENEHRRIETFTVASADCSEYTGMKAPLCFNDIVGCALGSSPFEPWSKPDLAVPDSSSATGWEAFRKGAVHRRCPAGHTESSPRAEVVRVVFVSRKMNRRILNLEEILTSCNGSIVEGKTLHCTAKRFDNIFNDICVLQAIDVLIGLHGADLVNAVFMRPGTSLVEIRAAGWWDGFDGGPKGLPSKLDFWGNAILQKMWYTNSTFYWWYGANETESSFSDEELAAGIRNPISRDKDVRVVWNRLKCTLTKALAIRGRRAYEAQTYFGNFECTSSFKEEPEAVFDENHSIPGSINAKEGPEASDLSSEHECSRTSISILRILEKDSPLNKSDPTSIAFGPTICSIKESLECLPSSLPIDKRCDVAFGVALRASLRRNAAWDESSRSCDDTPGKQVHYGTIALWNYAKRQDRIRSFRFSDNSTKWLNGSDFPFCAARKLSGFNCFFRPGDEAEADYTDDERISVDRYRVDPTLVHPAMARWDRIAPAAQLLIFSQLTRLVFNRSPAFVAFYRRVSRTIQQVASTGSAVAVHVRRGDACQGGVAERPANLTTHDSDGTRRCYATKVYADELELVTGKYSITDVYLASTGLDVLKDFEANYSSLFVKLNWHYLDFDHSVTENGSTWYEHREQSSRSRIGAGSWADMWHLSNGDVFIGSFASHFTRGAWELGMGRKGRFIPYVSVDGRSPCCDISERCADNSRKTIDECLSWQFGVEGGTSMGCMNP